MSQRTHFLIPRIQELVTRAGKPLFPNQSATFVGREITTLKRCEVTKFSFSTLLVQPLSKVNLMRDWKCFRGRIFVQNVYDPGSRRDMGVYVTSSTCARILLILRMTDVTSLFVGSIAKMMKIRHFFRNTKTR